MEIKKSHNDRLPTKLQNAVSEIADLNMSNSKLMAKISTIKNVGIQFTKRLLLARDLLESLKSHIERKMAHINSTNNTSSTCSVVGSFNRQLLELPFALADDCAFDLRYY